MSRKSRFGGLPLLVATAGSFKLLACVCMLQVGVDSFTPQTALASHRNFGAPKLQQSTSLFALASEILELLDSAQVIDPRNNKQCTALDGLFLSGKSNNKNNNNPLASILSRTTDPNQKALIVVMPQLGDFDSAEYAEQLVAIQNDLDNAKMSLRIIGIGDTNSARRFANFAGLPLDTIRVDPQGKLHLALNLHGGPDWDIPSFLPDGILQWFANYVGANNEDTQEGRRLVARSWLNYMAMCAGIAAPDTLPEILRGYFGDKSAPERLRPDETVRVGDDLIAVTGVTNVKLGPIEYQSLWKNEKGYQRPAELATVRLRAMVEVLSNFKEYVPDQKYLHLRGATYILDNKGQVEYEHRDTGVLAYSATMPRPLTFLEPYLGEKALNPLELGDNARAEGSKISRVEYG